MVILFLLIGISIGISIETVLNKKSNRVKEDLIKTCEELILEHDKNIKLYDEYVELLEGEYIESYKKALDDTLKDNIKLRKKLKAYE